MLFERPDGRGVRVEAMPRSRARLLDRHAKQAAQDAVLLEFSDRGLSSAEIVSIGVIDLSERGVRKAIARARKLRDRFHEMTKTLRDPEVVPMFGCQPWSRNKEELPKIGQGCTHCHRRIPSGSKAYCPKCASTGYDQRFARELAEDIRKNPPQDSVASKSKLQGSSSTGEHTASAATPRLTNSHRIELARTPQGYIFLQSIGQLPSEPNSSSGKGKRKHKQATVTV